jgi:hypothetical protein
MSPSCIITPDPSQTSHLLPHHHPDTVNHTSHPTTKMLPLSLISVHPLASVDFSTVVVRQNGTFRGVGPRGAAVLYPKFPQLVFWFSETLRTSIDNFDSFLLTFWVLVRPLVPITAGLFVVRWIGRFRGAGRFMSCRNFLCNVVCSRACSQRDCIILDKICQIYLI